ncbi:lytic transglycosylase domain-containing protein [soil metagenome]
MKLLLKRLLVVGLGMVLVSGGADGRTEASGGSVVVLAQAAEGLAQSPRHNLSSTDADGLKQALAAARASDRGRFANAVSGISDPVAKKIAAWAMIDVAGEDMSFFELDQARRDLADWPRGARRQALAEQQIETAGLDPAGVIQWFGGAPPRSARGAMGLAAAYQATNQAEDAKTLIRNVWRGHAFDADTQRALQGRFGALITPEDTAVRVQFLLYGAQGPSVRDLLPQLPGDQRALAEARIALRSDARNAAATLARVPARLQSDPGLTYERAASLRRRGQPDAALALVSNLPPAPGSSDGDDRLWTERRQLINAALKKQDYRAAYQAATNHGFTDPVDLTDAEFYAGWQALSKLNDAAGADVHFARIQAAGSSPITQGRALYWRGRAHEAMGDKPGADAFYAQGGRYWWTFYGQLAAEAAGQDAIKMGKDPDPTPVDQARFEGREVVQAARILAEAGEKDLFRIFVLHIDDNLPNGQEYALLFDLAHDYGDLDLAMRVARTAAQKGYVLPGRGYPVRLPPMVQTSAEAALVFGITRQESGFDPSVRSGADARGMMQLLPSTAQVVARKLGMPFSGAQLFDADYNMKLGASYIGQLVDQFGGSYLLAAAAYNAGPGRPTEWMTFCGDPRAPGTDPLDFVECIPFSETRNYVMRVMEGTQVYRARLNNGEAAPTLSEDLKRGSAVVAQAGP